MVTCDLKARSHDKFTTKTIVWDYVSYWMFSVYFNSKQVTVIKVLLILLHRNEENIKKH